MPRLGVGMPITAGLSQEAVTIIDDFFFESHASGEVTPINTATRSNLFTYSHDFSQSDWSKADSKIETSSITDPFGGTGSYKLTTEGNTNQSYVQDTLTTEVGKYYTFSVYAQKGEYDYVALVGLNPVTIHYFNLANGTTASAHSIQPVIEDAGNGWFRCSVTLVADTTSKFAGIYLAGDAGDISLGGVADDLGVYIYGAQFEQHSPVSALITSSGSATTVSTTLNDTSEVWDFDSTDITLEADPEDEGFWEEGSNLVLNHDYEELGSEQVTNGNFATDSDWTKSSQSTISSGSARILSSDGSYQYIAQSNSNFTASQNKLVKVTLEIINYVSGSLKAQFNGGTNYNFPQSVGTHSLYFTNDGTVGTLTIARVSGVTDITIDNISVKQVDPNDRWTLGTGWSIEDGTLIYTGTSVTNAEQAGILTANTNYELTYTVVTASGDGNFKLFGETTSTTNNLTQTVGTHTKIFFTDGSNGTDFGFRVTGNTSGSFVIDNVTVKEYAITPQDV